MASQKTKTGSPMDASLRMRILEVMTDPKNDGKTQKQIAEILKVSVRTVQNYLTENLWKDIEERRLLVIKKSIQLVDEAVYAKAIKGDMAAAKLLYTRWDNLKQQEEFHKIYEQSDEELEEIKRLEQQIQELTHEQITTIKEGETLPAAPEIGENSGEL